MRTIPLTQGFSAIVDECDFEYCSQFRWFLHKSGNGRVHYARRKAPRRDGRQRDVTMHRDILARMGTQVQGVTVDHVNGDGLDNRRQNLRSCTRLQNLQNARPRKTSRSGFKGVKFKKEKNRWCVRITIDGKKHDLGCYRKPEQAARAYNEIAKRVYGEFAWLNPV